MELTSEEIRKWLQTGKKLEATHMIVAFDTFDYEYYPVYVFPYENVRDKRCRYEGKEMQTVMEVYNLSMDWDKQLNSFRSFNY